MILFLLLVYGAGALEVSTSRPMVTPNNDSHVELHCNPAETFIQTHMAPDFITPQLVRRLDWFHEDDLVASYQQTVVADASRQWWVADGRFSLDPVFHFLIIQSVLPEDAGVYRCRLETDPLFSLTMSTAQVELAVMVRPVPPSSPEVKSSSNRSVTLSWNHNSARSHRPILRFSVGVRSTSDDTRFVIPAPSNATSVIVDNLSAFTLYAFSVRAENAAGESDFGPETKHRTKGDPPSSTPHVVSISPVEAGCVSLVVEAPPDVQGDLNGYTVVTTREQDNTPKTEYFPSSSKSPLRICHLLPDSEYVVSVVAETDFGPSPAVLHTVQTEHTAPVTAPGSVMVRPVPASLRLEVQWKPPEGVKDVVRYNVYHRAHGHGKWRVERVPAANPRAEVFRHEIIGIAPFTKYSVRISASTAKGEGPKSREEIATTDVEVPSATEILDLSFDCSDGVHLKWAGQGEKIQYRVELANATNTLTFNTTQDRLDVIGLSLHSAYSVRVSAVVRSEIANPSLLVGPWGQQHGFLLSDQCSYQSSICTANAKCQRLVQTASPRRFSYVFAVAAISLFGVLSFFVVYSLKGKCLDVKLLLKKKEKCVYLEELSPLVYDSTGCEDIPVELFYGYCEDLSRNDNTKYKMQFEQVEHMTSDDCTEPDALERNLDKNRYLNIGAMEASRVRLHSAAGSDYINANYIDSCEKPRAYIATQAPLPSTFADFWAMVWQERCNVIVMITNMVEDGRRKCDPYWPSSIQSPQSHGSYQVALVTETVNAHFVHRILSLKISKCVPPTERRVHQLHFLGWPDHGVPSSVFPLLSFMNFASDIHSTGPIVVHCSAGVGRSGSYILVDSMRRHLINFRRLNVMGHLIHMRRQREKLVQTVEQYILCHEAVRQLIRHGITRVHADLFQRYLNYLGEENVNGKTRMQMQYEDLCECHHSPQCQPPLEFVQLPGYHRLDEFLVASWPTECEQLWQLVWTKSCQTIILLGDDDYWTGLDKVGEMSVQHGDNFVLIQNKEDQLCVRIVTVSRSALESEFWGELERIQQERLAYHDAPLLILSPPNKTASWSTRSVTGLISEGLHYDSPTISLSIPLGGEPSPALAYILCALTSLACQLEQQGCIDVVQTLASYSRLHCGIWTSRTDIEFIYDRLAVLVGGSRV